MKSKSAVFITLVFFIGLYGCVDALKRVNFSDPQSVANATSIRDDSFKKIRSYVGPTYNQAFLRAWKNFGSERVGYQMYMRTRYHGAWKFFNAAYDSNGNKLDFVSIDRNVDYNKYSADVALEEDFGVNLSREYLNAHAAKGVSVKVYGKSGGAKIYTLPPTYVRAFLDTVDRN